MDVWSHDRSHMGTQDKIKKVEMREGAIQSYRWLFGKLRETSVFPLTKLIMDAPGIPMFAKDSPSVYDLLPNILYLLPLRGGA
jgi:hypothetical protein